MAERMPRLPGVRGMPQRFGPKWLRTTVLQQSSRHVMVMMVMVVVSMIVVVMIVIIHEIDEKTSMQAKQRF